MGSSSSHSIANDILHQSLQENSDLTAEDIREFLSRDIDCISRRSHGGWLPLHTAIIYRHNLEVIQELVNAYPLGMYEPLYTSYRGVGHNSDVISYLKDIYPETDISHTVAERLLPIHLACIGCHPSNSNVISYLAERSPESLRLPTKDGLLPIHLLCWYQNMPKIVAKLVDIYPESLLTKDCNGKLPIHSACGYCQNNTEVILYLANHNPKSLHIHDSTGYLPIYHACTRKSLNVVQSLVDLNPESLLEESSNSTLPIHVACYHVNTEVAIYLAKRCPESLLIAERELGFLPIHISCNSQNSGPIINALIDICPETLLIGCNAGRLPIHLAINRSLSSDITLSLIRRCPVSLITPNNAGDMPIHALLTSYPMESLLNIVRVILRVIPDAFQIRGLSHEGRSVLERASVLDGGHGLMYRMILNSSPSSNNLYSMEHQSNLKTLNWDARKSAVILSSRLARLDERDHQAIVSSQLQKAEERRKRELIEEKVKNHMNSITGRLVNPFIQVSTILTFVGLCSIATHLKNYSWRYVR